MANRWKGNFVVATAATSSGTNYTGRADGSWGLNSQLQQKQGSLWSVGIGVPSVPTIGAATSTASQQATINFTPSTITGGGTLTYTATSTPSGITGTSTTSPINITGLTNGASYTFTVKATNSFGYSSAESLASNSVTPAAAGVLTGAGASNNSLSAFSLYPWVSGTGFGTKAADAVGFSGFPNTVCYSPNNTTAFAGGTFELFACSVGSTFGTKYANPSTLVGSSVNGINMDSTGNTLFAVSYSSPVVNAYTWSSGFGSKYADPSAIPSGNAVIIQSSYITNKIAFSTNATPYIRVYAWSSGFGTAYANPSTIPTTSSSGMTFSPSENTIIFGDGVTPFMQAYTWSNGFGTKYSAPATALSATIGGDLVFNPEGTVIVVPVLATPFVMAYAWTTGSGFGTKYANPSTLPTSFGRAASFNSTNDVIIGHSLSPFILAYTWSSGFGTKYANPSTLPAGGSGSPRVSSVKFSN